MTGFQSKRRMSADKTADMNSTQIQEAVYNWACEQNFTAPYGILRGEHVNNKGTKFLAVTFGRARTLDATVEIYNRHFIVVRTSNYGSDVYNDFTSLMLALKRL